MATIMRISDNIFHLTSKMKHYALIVCEFIVYDNEFISLLSDDVEYQGKNSSGGFDIGLKFRVCSDQQNGTGSNRVVTLYYYKEIMDPNAVRTRPEIIADINNYYYIFNCELYDQSDNIVDGPKNVTITQNSSIIID